MGPGAEFDVAIVGGGPVGLWLAREVSLSGCRAVVIERNEQARGQSRAGNLQPRSLEIFSMRGVVEQFLPHARQVATGHFASLNPRLKLADLKSNFNYMVFIPQSKTEEILERLAIESGAQVLRGHEVVEIAQHDGQVAIKSVAEGAAHEVRCRYVVGCDGARSFVRKAAGIEFVGEDAFNTCFLADVKLTDPPEELPLDIFNDEGTLQIFQWPSGDYRILRVDPRLSDTSSKVDVSLDEVRESVARIIGNDLGITEVTWGSRVASHARIANRYLSLPLILAGDAAHIHPPHGGRGMNIGLEDATNLGWKLSAVCNGWADPRFLSTYHEERYPVGTKLLDITMAQDVIASEAGQRGGALRALISSWLEIPEVHQRMANDAAGLAHVYPRSEDDHELVGRRLPYSPLKEWSDVEQALHTARHVLIDGTADQRLMRETCDQVTAVAAPQFLQTLGVTALIARPDGYVRWVTTEARHDVLKNEVRKQLERLFE